MLNMYIHMQVKPRMSHSIIMQADLSEKCCVGSLILFILLISLLLVYYTFKKWIKSSCKAFFCIRRHKVQPLHVNDNRQISDRLLTYRSIKDWIKTHSIDKIVSYFTKQDEILPFHNGQTSNVSFKDWIKSYWDRLAQPLSK